MDTKIPASALPKRVHGHQDLDTALAEFLERPQAEGQIGACWFNDTTITKFQLNVKMEGVRNVFTLANICEPGVSL